MLVLFETPAGYAIFKLLDEKKLKETENLFQNFETPEKARKLLKLKLFHKFDDAYEALAATTALVEGKVGKGLKKLLKKLVSQEAQETLLVADAKLGNTIKDKFKLECCTSSAVQELMRCIRSQAEELTAIPGKEVAAMALGLAHSLSRYKLKFSPDKVDTMIVQAISLLDDLDKELNNYVMRCREWYGWHFPELGKIIQDNLAYCRVVARMRQRTTAVLTDFSDILPEEIEQQMKEAAEISMGVEIAETDVTNIIFLCDQAIEMSLYRTQLYDYLKNRMMAVAPNLTILVGDLVGARLISHAGSLMNLAKHPASTVQILGAEKALFRALKTRHDTPKYGLIYHASLVGQATPKNKGKVSRMLANKAALAIRIDALGEDTGCALGMEHKANLESRIRQLEQGKARKFGGSGKVQTKYERYENKSEIRTYKQEQDSTIPVTGKKHKMKEEEQEVQEVKAKKPRLVEEVEPDEEEEVEEEQPKKKKKKKAKVEPVEVADESATFEAADEDTVEVPSAKKKKKKKKIKEE